MNSRKLTNSVPAVHKIPMDWIGRGTAGLVLGMAASMLAGCISVEAPDKPIVIELNINITQEVTYRLAGDAGNTIEENADIF